MDKPPSPADALASVLAPTRNGVGIRIQAKPRAAQDAFAGVVAGRLCVRVAAPPADGAANAALRRFLALALGVPPSAVEITHGVSGREKSLHIHGLDAATAERRLRAALDGR